MATSELVAEMAKLRTQLAEAREKRHDGNGALNDALLAFQNANEEQGNRLAVVEKAMLYDMPQLIRNIEIIKTRIVGDDAMKTPGLIQQMTALDREVSSLHPRMTAVEAVIDRVKANEVKIEAVATLAKANSWDLKMMKIVGGAIATVLVSMGGLITWAKSTDFVRFLVK